MSKFTATSTAKGQRLDKFLTEKLGQTRSQIQKIIKAGGVLVNNKKPTIHQFLKTGDIIIIKTYKNNLRAHPEPAPSNDGVGARPSKKGAQASAPEQSKSNLPAQASVPELRLNIVADKKDYLIINKPAGLIVHEAPGHTDPTLVDLILKKYPQIAKIGEDPMRPGIVHRLDREVSGLIVMAKTQSMFDHLKKQFKTRQIKKQYTALVYGAPQKLEGEITFNIDRSETINYKMAAVPEHEPRGRKAITRFEVTERLGNYTLLKIKPQTGRTHQIRVHLNAYGLPIVGDQTYKPKKLKTKINMDRIFLNAHYLGFKNLNGEWTEFTAPLPSKLQDILAQLKKTDI